MVHLKVLPCLLGIGMLTAGLILSPVVAIADLTCTTDVIDQDVTDKSTPPHVIGHISSSVKHVFILISEKSLPCCTSAPDPTSAPPQLGDQSVTSTDSYVLVDSDVEVRTQNFNFDFKLASRFTSLPGPGSKKIWQKLLGTTTTTLTHPSRTVHCGERSELWKDEQTFIQTETEISADKKIGKRTCTTKSVSLLSFFGKTNHKWDPRTEKIIEGTPCAISYTGWITPEPKSAAETPK